MPATRPTSPTLGMVTVVMTLVGWASVPLFLRHFSELMDFWSSNGWRYGFSALVWAPMLIWLALHRNLPPGLWKAALIPSVVNTLGQICFTWAHYRIDPGLLTFGLRSQLIFVAVGAWILFPAERAIIRRPGYLIGAAILIMGMTGVVVMSKPHDDHAVRIGVAALEAGAAHLEGIGLAILSGLLFAAYGLAVRKYMHGINPVVAFATICQYTAFALVVLMLLFDKHHGWSVVEELPIQQIVLLLLSALIGIAIGHVFYYISIARLGVAVTAGVLQLQPFMVAIGSLLLFGERLAVAQWVAGCFAVGGAMLMLSVQWMMSRRAPVIEEPVAIAEGESGS